MNNRSLRCLFSFRLTRVAVLILGAWVGINCGVPTLAQPKGEGKDAEFQRSNSKILAAFRDVVARPSESTVQVQCDGKDATLGTAVAPDGWILTKASPLKGKIVCRLRDGRELDARIVGVHEDHDLAMLKIDANGLTPVEWAESKTAAVGDWVASPRTGDDPVVVGVVGVGTRKIPDPGGFLGISFVAAVPTAKIAQVIPGTAAARAGLKVNDHILAIAGKNIDDQEACIEMIAQHKPGETLALRIKRGDDELEVKATLGKRPPGESKRGEFQNKLGSELSERRIGYPVVLQHDSVLRPRDCGGPIVGLDGKALGINVARAGRTESYAVPSEAILPLLADLKSGKLAPKEVKPEGPSKEVLAARDALRKADAEQAAAEKKLAAARDALKRAETEQADAEKKHAEARAKLERAEAEDKAARKPEPKPKDE
jgi:serine protease Do